MADRLEVSEAPDDPRRPRVCCDERPCPLLGDGRAPVPLVPGVPARFDAEDTRPGTCTLLIMVEPFHGWRQLPVTTRRTQRECAPCLAELVDIHFPAAAKSRVGWDHLRPHTAGALDAVFSPAEARRI
jgi:hypothetical protein